MTSPPSALHGITVLDLTQGVAGPFCTRLLAGYGADVLKIEMPGRGDVSRHAAPFYRDSPHPESSGLFFHLNGGKRSITLNLRSPTGRAIFLHLARDADLVVESFRPGTMARFGLGRAELLRANPFLVLSSISNFGQSGPYRDYEAVDLIAQAYGGPLMYGQGLAEKTPLKFAGNSGLYYAGVMAALAAMGAVLFAKMGGPGQHVDTSIVHALMSSPEHKPISAQYTGAPTPRATSVSRWSYLMGFYPCKDGFIGVQGSGRGETWWPRVYRMMGMPELERDPRFSTPEARDANRDDFEALWYAWLADHTRQKIFAAATAARYPLAPVYTPADLATDPHFTARRFFEPVRRRALGTILQPGAPAKLLGSPWLEGQPAPALGEHNHQIYAGRLGYSAKQLAEMRSAGMI